MCAFKQQVGVEQEGGGSDWIGGWEVGKRRHRANAQRNGGKVSWFRSDERRGMLLFSFTNWIDGTP